MAKRKQQAQPPAANKRKKKEKNKTDPKTPMKRVLVLRNNKCRLEWHPW